MDDQWQSQFALPDWQKKLTVLPPPQENQFKEWVNANQIHLTDDYDMRGWFSNDRGKGGISNADGKWHYPDTWKTPLHRSFSGESRYFNPAMKDQAPNWIESNTDWQLKGPDGKVYFVEKKKNPRLFGG